MRTRTILVSVFGLVLSAVSSLRAEVAVFGAGRVRLPVIVAADAVPEERAAAEELARVLGVMSGLDWPVLTESKDGRGGPRWDGSPHGERGGPRWDGEAGFYVGHTRAAARGLRPLRPAADLLAPKADEIGPDGFRVITRGGNVFLEGATPEATANAVSWLLQRQGGVRWYAPGPLGEVIPRRTAWTLPELCVAREPAYVSREITGLHAPAAQAWARHNGLRQRLEYSHHLLNVFPPELGAAHPEWFPLVQGRRLLPASKADYNWQPDLARPEVAEWAAQQAAAAFARTPERASFSLGMNDSVRFDQGEGTQAVVEPLRYFRGMPDYSPLVFGFMNRAAEALGREARQPALGRTHPEKYLGCLAYFWCENPPPFPVSRQVVPYVTTDRTQFYDADYRAADQALMSRWGRSGVRAFGLWEYGYGHAYAVPRVPHAMLAEAVREGWWRGARGYIADTGPHWGFDAFKVWMLAQLLWEPDRTTAELEDDFFTGWYGPAAEPMRRFFARCEAQWMAQEGPAWWIKFYRQQDQVLLFPPEVCRELRAMLTEAEARASTLAYTAQDVTATPQRRPACSHALPKHGTQGVPLPGEPILRPETRTSAGACKHADLRGTDSDISAHQCASVVNPNPKPETLYSARIALTSRAFSVTEAAVEFGRLRSVLSAAPETILAEELAPLLQQLQRARIALERAAQAAAVTGEGGLSAMATGDMAFLLRNDPVPRLLAALGRRDPNAPADALSGLRIAGNPVPAHWADLAAACTEGRFAQLKNRLANGDFSHVAASRQEPAFLYPLWGQLPADWTVRGIATETGRVALLPANAGRATENHLSPLRSAIGRNGQSLAATDGEAGEASRGPVGPWLEAGCVPGLPSGGYAADTGTEPAARTLRIEGAWETQLVATVPATPGRLHVVEARMRGRSSPGDDAALFLVFVTADGRSTGEYRTQTLPKGASGWRTQLLAATAPADAVWVSVGVAALRQPAGDWLEVAAVELKD